jgi:hypothetical protein
MNDMEAEVESVEPTEPSKEEGNKFSGELADAKKDGKKEFDVDGKKYKVEADAFVEDEVKAEAEEKDFDFSKDNLELCDTCDKEIDKCECDGHDHKAEKIEEATGKCKDCGCIIDDPKPGCDCPHDVHDASQDNWVKEANRLKELSGIISEAPVRLQNKRGFTPGVDTSDAGRMMDINNPLSTPKSVADAGRMMDINNPLSTPKSVADAGRMMDINNPGRTKWQYRAPAVPASQADAGKMMDINNPQGGLEYTDELEPTSDNNPNLDKYQDDEFKDMVRSDDEEQKREFNFRDMLNKLYRKQGSNPANEFENVEETKEDKSIKVDKLVPIAGDSIWDKEGNNPKQIKIDSISITNPYEEGSYMADEEDDGYRTVNVEHDGPWSIYTDSGFEKAVSEMVGFEVDFTEQGMQEDGMASMEGMMDDKIKSEAFANYKPNRFKDMPKGMNEAPTMDTTQLITLLKNSGLTEAEIKQRVDEWANTPAEGASEDKETSHGEPYENFAQSVNLSLKKYLDAEDFKVGLKEHKVDEIKEAYKKSKKAKKDKK